MDNSRRDFIKKAGIGLTTAFVGSSLLPACTDSVKTGDTPFHQIGLQLYSLRDLLLVDPKLVIETVAKIGYKHVETYGVDINSNSFWGIQIRELKKIWEGHNISSHSGHYELGKYLSKNHSDKESLEKYIEIAHELGQKYIIAPTPPIFDLNNLTVSDYQYAADQLNKAGEMSKKAGITMGFHNHFWEFRPFANGTKGLDILIALTEPDLVSFELDIYWIEKAGLNPQSYFEKYPGRFHLWHVKDMDRNYSHTILGDEYDKQPLDSLLKHHVRYTEVGSGSIDYATVAQSASKSGLMYAFVEQDDIYMPNKFESLQKSFQYIQKHVAK